jgi:sugar phosphate isomerase/epimerase
MLPGMTAPISVQLYSLREEAAADFPAVIARLGRCGFVGVELAGFHGLTPADFNRHATDAGLVVSSAHVNDLSPEAFRKSLHDMLAVGCTTAILAFQPPEMFASLEAIGQVAASLNAAQEIATASGVLLGYHNHFWEFEQKFDGRTGWSVLFDQLAPGIIAELDIYWAKLGGADPVAVINDLGPRLRLLHVKDGPADDPKNPMVAVGSGVVDIPGILHSAPTAQWHIVELDRCATDMFDAVEGSYRYLTSAGLSQGRV